MVVNGSISIAFSTFFAAHALWLKQHVHRSATYTTTYTVQSPRSYVCVFPLLIRVFAFGQSIVLVLRAMILHLVLVSM